MLKAEQFRDVIIPLTQEKTSSSLT
uniref:Uncharacterized protein n=1 Tax=Arundo donax TaxID=35708 RepID=A0A0A9FDW2_ARUDO